MTPPEDQEVIDRIPDFIVFSQNRIFRKLRTRRNEVKKTFLATSGDNTQFITLPDDFEEVKFLTYDKRPLERRSPRLDLAAIDESSVLLIDGHYPRQALRAVRQARRVGAPVVAYEGIDHCDTAGTIGRPVT